MKKPITQYYFFICNDYTVDVVVKQWLLDSNQQRLLSFVSITTITILVTLMIATLIDHHHNNYGPVATPLLFAKSSQLVKLVAHLVGQLANLFRDFSQLRATTQLVEHGIEFLRRLESALYFETNPW